MRVNIHIQGIVSSPAFQRASFIGKELARAQDGVQAHVVPLISVKWEAYFESKAREMGGGAMEFFVEHADSPLVVFTTKRFIGGSDELEAYAKQIKPDFVLPEPPESFEAIGKRELVKALKTEHTLCFMEFESGGRALGRVVFELFSDVCPRTAANFEALCEGSHDGLTYTGTHVTRVNKGGWIQCGDVGRSIHGDVFEDENFVVRHDSAYVLGMANKGRHTNSSQFYITLKPLPAFDTNYVAFGRVVDGVNVLKALDSAHVLYSQKPVNDIVITACGRFDLEAFIQ